MSSRRSSGGRVCGKTQESGIYASQRDDNQTARDKHRSGKEQRHGPHGRRHERYRGSVGKRPHNRGETIAKGRGRFLRAALPLVYSPIFFPSRPSLPDRRQRRDLQLRHGAEDVLRRVQLHVEQSLRYPHLREIVRFIAYGKTPIAELLGKERKI